METAGADDVVVINLSCDSAVGVPYGEQMRAMALAIGTVRARLRGPILVSSIRSPEETAEYLASVLGTSSIPIFDGGASDPAALRVHWESAGVHFVHEPREEAELIRALATGAPNEDQVRTAQTRFRLILVQALERMRGIWHSDKNNTAALRILGGAILSWLEDVHSSDPERRCRPRGISPESALAALDNWDSSQQAPPEFLSPLKETVRGLSTEPGPSTPTGTSRRAILIDDQATVSGWEWVLRVICRERFGLEILPSDVETDFTVARDRIVNREWLRGIDLVLLDMRFPNHPTGGVELLEDIRTAVYPVPVVIFSVDETGSTVRSALRRGALYFFKEQADDRSPVDYYRHLEETVFQALTRAPRLVAARCWSAVNVAPLGTATPLVFGVNGWVEQGIELLNGRSYVAGQPSTADLAVLRAGIALEQVVDPALSALVASLDTAHDVGPTRPSKLYSLDLFVRPDAYSLGRSASEWQSNRGMHTSTDKFRIDCGYLIRDLRNCIAHGRIAPQDVTELEAVPVYLSLAYFITPCWVPPAPEAEKLVGPLREHLKLEHAVSHPLPMHSGYVDPQAVAKVCSRLVQAWNLAEPGQTMLSLSQLVKHVGQGHKRLTRLGHCVLLAQPLQSYHPVDPISSVIAEVCWRRVGELNLSLVAP